MLSPWLQELSLGCRPQIGRHLRSMGEERLTGFRHGPKGVVDISAPTFLPRFGRLLPSPANPPGARPSLLTTCQPIYRHPRSPLWAVQPLSPFHSCGSQAGSLSTDTVKPPWPRLPHARSPSTSTWRPATASSLVSCLPLLLLLSSAQPATRDG